MRPIRALLAVPMCCALPVLGGCVDEGGEIDEVAPTAAARLTASEKDDLIAEVKTRFALPALQVNEDEVLDVTVDDPRIVDRAALGTRYMSWNDPETSAVAEGMTKYYPNASAPSPYVRLRLDASFGELYVVDCRVTDGTG